MGKKSKPLEFKEKVVKLADLVPYERNPRKISEADFKKLKESLDENGYHHRIVIDSENHIVAGHQRCKALMELKYVEAPVLYPSRPLTEKEFQQINMRDNISAGEWDFEVLEADFEVSELVDFGFSESEISGLAFGVEKGPNDAEKEYEGMPEFENTDPCHRKVIVSFEDEKAVQDFFALIKQEFTEKTKSIWFPEKERDDVDGLRWDDESKDDSTDEPKGE